MRIGMILDKPFPPDPRVENEAVSLIKAEHEVYLFCLTYSKENPEETINGIFIKRYRTSNLIYKLSALTYTIPEYTFIMAKRIQHFLVENKIDVIHIHDMQIAAAVFKANKKLKLKTVLDLHENRPEIMKWYPHLQKFPGKYLISSKIWKKKEEQFVKKANKVIVVTEEAKQELIDRIKLNKSNFVIVPNTVHKSYFEKAQLNKNLIEKYKTNFVLLYIGDTGLRRGLLTAIEALIKLKEKIPTIKLVIVGSNSSDVILKKEVKKQQLENFVDFEGWQPEQLLPSYIATSSVCISPLHRNLHHDTTYANKLFQYMSFAKPLLVSNATSQKNIVLKAKAGLIHEAENYDDFFNKVLELYQKPELQQQLGSRGKHFIENEFYWEKTSEQLQLLYKELLG